MSWNSGFRSDEGNYGAGKRLASLSAPGEYSQSLVLMAHQLVWAGTFVQELHLFQLADTLSVLLLHSIEPLHLRD